MNKLLCVFLLLSVAFWLTEADTKQHESRRHKRSYFNFLDLKPDPACNFKLMKRPMLACPRKDINEAPRCIELADLCDDYHDCAGGEDENPVFCMFKRLEEAELVYLEAKLRFTVFENDRKHHTSNYLAFMEDTPVNDDVMYPTLDKNGKEAIMDFERNYNAEHPQKARTSGLANMFKIGN